MEHSLSFLLSLTNPPPVLVVKLDGEEVSVSFYSHTVAGCGPEPRRVCRTGLEMGSSEVKGNALGGLTHKRT